MKCGFEICRNSQRSNKFDFIKKSILIHKNKYDYSNIKYLNNKLKINILCKMHGEFKQSPNSHLVGRGCPLCGIEKQKTSTKFTLKEFIEKSKSIHGNLYDYSKTNYINCHTKITIGCKKHGEFKQLPLNHLKRNGCPECQSSYGENEISMFLKNNNIKYEIEKTFNNCRNTKTNRLLRFDFYIPTKNILIEYDGKHHFMIGQFGKYKSTKSDLKNVKLRDKIKTDFCKINNIKLLRIKYIDINNITKILKSNLKA